MVSWLYSRPQSSCLSNSSRLSQTKHTLIIGTEDDGDQTDQGTASINAETELDHGEHQWAKQISSMWGTLTQTMNGITEQVIKG